jgi:hypothetical protein
MNNTAATTTEVALIDGRTVNGVEIAGRTDADLIALLKSASSTWSYARRDNGYRSSSPMERSSARTAQAAREEMARRGIEIATRPAAELAPKGKVMAARFAGTCADCGGHIAKGETIRFDGKAHHVSH